MQLLKEVPHSVLWLMNFNDESSDAVMEMARAHLGSEWVDEAVELLLVLCVDFVLF